MDAFSQPTWSLPLMFALREASQRHMGTWFFLAATASGVSPTCSQFATHGNRTWANSHRKHTLRSATCPHATHAVGVVHSDALARKPAGYVHSTMLCCVMHCGLDILRTHQASTICGGLHPHVQIYDNTHSIGAVNWGITGVQSPQFGHVTRHDRRKDLLEPRAIVLLRCALAEHDAGPSMAPGSWRGVHTASGRRWEARRPWRHLVGGRGGSITS